MMASEKNGKNMKIHTVSATDFIPQYKVGNRKKFWPIDKEMLHFKIHYFLITGAFGLCLPYITILAQKRVGISASALAAILTTQRCIFIFAKPALGYIADYFKKMKAMICILLVLTIVFLFLILAVPKIEKEKIKTIFDKVENDSIQFEYRNNSDAYVVCELHQSNKSQSELVSYFNYSRYSYSCLQSQNLSDFFNQCSENKKNGPTNTSNYTEYLIDLEKKLSALTPILCKVCCKLNEECQRIDCEDSKSSTKDISSGRKNISDFQTYQFWLYFFITTISQACANNLYTLTDTACCESVQKTGAQFGRQCLWGAIGWGLMAPVGGLLNDYTGDFLASWIFMVMVSFLSLLNLSKLEIENPVFSKNLLKDIGIVLSSKEFLAFAFCVVMNGVGIGIIWFYLFLFLTDIGGSRFLCGMVMFVEFFLGGIPFMFFAGWVIKKIGHFNVLILSLLAYCIRFFWCSQLHNPWLVLPVEVLHGITEGLLYTNVASYAKLSAKPGTETTTQALLFTAHEGIGIGIGCVVAGLGFDSIGGHRTFFYLSIYAGCATILSIILHLLVRKQNRSTNVTISTNSR